MLHATVASACLTSFARPRGNQGQALARQPAALLARLQCNRERLLQAQGDPAQGRRADHRQPVGRHLRRFAALHVLATERAPNNDAGSVASTDILTELRDDNMLPTGNGCGFRHLPPEDQRLQCGPPRLSGSWHCKETKYRCLAQRCPNCLDRPAQRRQFWPSEMLPRLRPTNGTLAHQGCVSIQEGELAYRPDAIAF